MTARQQHRRVVGAQTDEAYVNRQTRRNESAFTATTRRRCAQIVHQLHDEFARRQRNKIANARHKLVKQRIASLYVERVLERAATHKFARLLRMLYIHQAASLSIGRVALLVGTIIQLQQDKSLHGKN